MEPIHIQMPYPLLKDYLEMLQGTRSAVEEGIKQGKSLAQLKQEKVLGKWDKWSSSFVTTDKFLETLYLDLTEESKVDKDHDMQ